MKLNCQQVQELLPSYVQGLCSEESRQDVEEHVRGCEECRELLDALQAREVELSDQPPAVRQKASPKKKRRNRVIALVAAVVLVFSSIAVAFLYNPNLYYEYLYWGDRIHINLTVNGITPSTPIDKCLTVSCLYVGEDFSTYSAIKNYDPNYTTDSSGFDSSTLDWTKLDLSSRQGNTLVTEYPGGQKGYYIIKIDIDSLLFFYLYPGISNPREDWDGDSFVYYVYNTHSWDVWDIDLDYKLSAGTQNLGTMMGVRTVCRTNKVPGNEDWNYEGH